ncbi:MAG: hypothetical protein WBF83_05695 [Moheibacter sp.]
MKLPIEPAHYLELLKIDRNYLFLGASVITLLWNIRQFIKLKISELY